MADGFDLAKLREVITENLRVQRGGDLVDYVSIGTALQDATARQNHAIFARRGCGKTLLLHHSSRILKTGIRSIYLNCEDFKRHSFPNVLIVILVTLFKEIDKNLDTSKNPSLHPIWWQSGCGAVLPPSDGAW